MKRTDTMRLNMKIVSLYLNRRYSTYEIAEHLNIDRTSVVKHLKTAEKISPTIAQRIRKQRKLNVIDSGYKGLQSM
jgi:predicted DNA-binding protein YlxM (UPF0122 family)